MYWAVVMAFLDAALFGYAWYAPYEDTRVNAEMVEQVQSHCIPTEDLERVKRFLEQGGQP